ncbi:hypothetical protein EDD29_0333 [Actinocorallia herbida]|uniref:Uncharacterized protein n=1 Tax=Actinocorallia herbida TaxID=58109 RepID=A0A3N1CQ52_9ACTN|nr:hypothetical protein EDD29_0333 [Actinocorallia herbida]
MERSESALGTVDFPLRLRASMEAPQSLLEQALRPLGAVPARAAETHRTVSDALRPMTEIHADSTPCPDPRAARR